MGQKTKAVRLHGADDLRMAEFELPEIKDDEILAKVVSDSICMSTHKLLKQGKAHKRCPQNVDTNPIIIGHEFAGDIVKVGKKWQGEFKPGEKFAQQPALNYKGSLASPGY
ncbi:MAG: alcohol dehydrogenase catalytic domain-containing protein, partial [Deltaproteobacteria bacterium]|nr:alcohol dehydrogenase catalytic domain-containing protein [Deltaproteobacteria bacterium]